MISSKAKERQCAFTTHNLQMHKIAKKLGAIPAAELKPEQKQFLADLAQDEKGILTIRDIHENKMAQKAIDDEAKRNAEIAAEVKKLQAAQAATDAKVKKTVIAKVKPDAKKKHK